MIVEDVLTTGGSVREVLALVRQLGGTPIGVASIEGERFATDTEDHIANRDDAVRRRLGIHFRDGDLPPKDPVAQLAERFRIEAEDMERAGCFEMAFTTVAAVCRLVAHADLVTRMLATAHLGRIARQLGDYRSAQDCYSCVVTEATRERDPPLGALGLLGLGGLARMKGNRPEERRLYGEALAWALPGGTAERSARQGLMNVAIAEDRLADALLHGWRVYDLAEEGGDVQAMILSDLALIALTAGFVNPAFKSASASCV